MAIQAGHDQHGSGRTGNSSNLQIVYSFLTPRIEFGPTLIGISFTRLANPSPMSRHVTTSPCVHAALTPSSMMYTLGKSDAIPIPDGPDVSIGRELASVKEG